MAEYITKQNIHDRIYEFIEAHRDDKNDTHVRWAGDHWFLNKDDLTMLIDQIPAAFDSDRIISQIRDYVGDCDGTRCKQYDDHCNRCRAETAVKIIQDGGLKDKVYQ